MYRILYQDLAGNFEISNTETPQEMERSAFDIASTTSRIICIYDYQHNRNLFTCSTYELFLDAVNEYVYENKKTA